MNRSKYMETLSTVVSVTEVARQARDVKQMIDLGLDTLRRFWLLPPLLAAGWAYMVSDEERLALLEGLADKVYDAFSPAGVST